LKKRNNDDEGAYLPSPEEIERMKKELWEKHLEEKREGGSPKRRSISRQASNPTPAPRMNNAYPTLP